MARKLRVEFTGAVYHIVNRGDRREAIFRDDQDRARFLTTLGEACTKTGWQVHAYCLMPNHFHLVVETPQPNLVAGMQWLLGTYTSRFNRRHQVVGHLFSGRYKSLLIGGDGGYLRTVSDYVHLNPVRAKLLRAGEPLRSYRWSSVPEYLTPPAQRPAWLRVDRVLGEWGIPKDSPAGRRAFERRLEERRRQAEDEAFRAIRQGWCFGDETFRQELLEKVATQAGPQHYGEELRESAAAKAERLVAEELRRRGWQESELAVRRKGDPGKVAIAERLRRETTMTLAWIAHRLQMGTKTHLAHLLHWHRRNA
jgi:putative transposase